MLFQTRFNDFCARFQIKSSNIVDKYTTHLITDEEGETLVCPLSKKVIQGIAYHMHILTYRWLDDCLKLNQIINEKPYEIQGDLTLSPDHYGIIMHTIVDLFLDRHSFSLRYATKPSKYFTL